MTMPDDHRGVIVHFRPATRNIRERSGDSQLYLGYVYAAPGLALPVGFQAKPSGQPASLAGMPLVGIETLTIQPTSHQSYLADFIEGEKGFSSMRMRLLETMSIGLRNLMMMPPSDVRLWWSSAAPELDDFPWELTFGGAVQPASDRAVMLRGAPPETPIPVLPVDQRPRLAVVGALGRRPPWIAGLQQVLGDAVVPIDLPVREALRRVAHEGFELVHVFSDGIVSSALEGILYDHSATARPELKPGELSSLLKGTRVSVLALSPDTSPSPDMFTLAGRSVLSAFRAFAYLGASSLPMPTILTPLGPMPEQISEVFWRRCHEGLMTEWHLTRSFRSAQQGFGSVLPVALFSHHSGGRLFEQAAGAAPDDTSRIETRESLLQTQQVLSTLEQLGEKYGATLPSGIRDLASSLEREQVSLRSTLDGWTRREEDLS